MHPGNSWERRGRAEDSDDPVPQPLRGRKLHINTDWGRDT